MPVLYCVSRIPSSFFSFLSPIRLFPSGRKVTFCIMNHVICQFPYLTLIPAFVLHQRIVHKCLYHQIPVICICCLQYVSVILYMWKYQFPDWFRQGTGWPCPDALPVSQMLSQENTAFVSTTASFGRLGICRKLFGILTLLTIRSRPTRAFICCTPSSPDGTISICSSP